MSVVSSRENNPLHLSSILDRLAEYTSRVNPAIYEHLQPPCTISSIERLKPFDYHIPREVLTLYQWQNGRRLNESDPWEELFYYHRFLPFEEAVQEYIELQAFGADVYDPHLLPIFMYMGEFYSVWCSEEPLDQSPVYFVYHDDAQVYDSLETMLRSILECYDTGAYTLVDDVYQPNRDQVAAIKRKWNLCRISDEGGMGDHP